VPVNTSSLHVPFLSHIHSESQCSYISRKKSSDTITVTLLDMFEEEDNPCNSSRKCLLLTEKSNVCNNALFSKHTSEGKPACNFYHHMLHFITVKS